MGKQNDAMELSTFTTGAGIAIGTNIDIGGIYRGATATTVTIKVGTSTLIDVSGAAQFVSFDPPAALTGAVTGTSSGGSFTVLFRQRG